MIELVDAALAGWLSTIEPSPEVTFERRLPMGDGDGDGADVRLVLVLGRVAEQVDKRDNRVDEVRGDDGAVVARQRPARYFELDYWCAVTGSATAAHQVLGELVRRLVDHDVVPRDFLPGPLADLGMPIDVELVTPANSAAALAIRVVLPVRPAPDREVSAPATILHLDMSPPPGTTGERATSDADPAGPEPMPMEERRWTTVRRRELIGRPAVDEGA
jgi:hypothetical protein